MHPIGTPKSTMHPTDERVTGEVLCDLTPEDLAKGVKGDVVEDVVALAREGYEASVRAARSDAYRSADPKFLEIMLDAELAKREAAERARQAKAWEHREAIEEGRLRMGIAETSPSPNPPASPSEANIPRSGGGWASPGHCSSWARGCES